MSSTQDFAELAGRFCTLIERAGRSDPKRLLARLDEVLSALYAAALDLPDLGGEPADLATVERLTEAQWAARFEELRAVLGPADRYRRTLGGSTVDASLADDLLGIYRDLAESLQALRSGASPADVISLWRVRFETGWSDHAAGALEGLRAAPGDP